VDPTRPNHEWTDERMPNWQSDNDNGK